MKLFRALQSFIQYSCSLILQLSPVLANQEVHVIDFISIFILVPNNNLWLCFFLKWECLSAGERKLLPNYNLLQPENLGAMKTILAFYCFQHTVFIW